MHRLINFINRLNETVGRSIAWLTLFMVITQFAVVVLRYAFNTGWIAMQESILFMHALVFLLGSAYTLHHNGHVRVDIFYQKMSRRHKALVDVIGSVMLLLPVCLYIGWISWDYVAESWRITEGSREAGGLPGVFLLKSSILAMAALLGLQGISMLCQNLLIVFGAGDESVENND